MFCSSKIKTTPRGGESPPSRDGKAPPNVATASGGVDQAVFDQLMQISVRGAPHQTHTLELKLSDTMADVNAEVERLGYDLSVDRLCRFGGASLPRDDRLTVAESGLHSNSSLQVLGRLRSGVEVPLFGRQHSLGDTGLLDLKGQDVGPAKLKEVAAFLASPESATVHRLVLSGNMLTDRGKDLFGLKDLCEVLPTLRHAISLDLWNCGLGVAEVNEVAKAIGAGAAIASLTISGNFIFGSKIDHSGLFSKTVHDVDKDQSGWNNLCEQLKGSNISSFTASDIGMGPVALRTLATSLPAAVARLILDENPLTGGDWSNVDKDITGVTSLFDTLKTSAVTELGLAKCRLGPGSLGKLAEYVRDAEAAVAHLALGSNPIGDKAMISLLDTVKDVPLISFDISNTRCGVSTASKLAELLSAETKFTAAVARLILDKNPLTGGTWRDVDKDITGVTSLFDTLKTSSVTELGLAECRLGPGSLGKLAEYVRDAKAALNSLKCGNNPGMVGELWGNGRLKTPDVHADVFKQLTDGLKSSQVTEVDFSSCGLGPVALGHLSEWVREATAAVARLILDENPLTGGDRRDVDKDITGVTSLFDTLKTSSVTELGLAKCRLGPGSLGNFAKYVRDTEAALNSLTIDSTGVPERYDWRGNLKDGTGPKTYTLTVGEEKIELSNMNLGSADVALVASWLQRPEVNAALNSVTVDSTGDMRESSSWDPQRGQKSYTLNASQESIDLSSKNLGPTDVALVAAWLKRPEVSAALNSVTIDSTGSRKLSRGYSDHASQEQVDASGPKTYTLTVGEQKIDLSQKNLSSADVALVAAWLQRPEVSAALNSLKCANNPGMVGELEYGELKTPDAHAEVFKQLTDNLKTSHVTEADFSSCGLGPVALGHLSEWVRDAEAVLNSVTVDSTGDTKDLRGDWNNGGPKTYTLTVGEEKIDLSQKNLGSADVALVTAWLQRPEVRAALTFINCLANNFGDDDLTTLLTAIEGTSVRSLCGLTEGQTTADFSGQNLRPIDMKIMAAEYGFQGFIAAVEAIAIGTNSITSDGRAILLEAIKTSKLKTIDIGKPLPLQEPYESDTLDLSNTHMDSGHVLLLSWWLGTEFSAAVTSINCLANKFGEDDLATLLTAIEGTSVRSLCGLTEGQTTADFSHQNLKPIDCKIMAAEFGFQGFIAALNSVTLDSTGDMRHQQTYTLTTSKEKIDLSKKNLGSADVALVATWLHRPHVMLNSVTLDSTGVPKMTFGPPHAIEASGPRTYTLTTCEGKIDLSQKNLGPADVALVATWLQRPEVSAVVASLRCGNNPSMVGRLDEYGIVRTPDAHAELFKELTDSLKTSQVTEADFSSCGLGPVALGHLIDWVRDATTAVACLILDENPLTGGEYDDEFDTDISGVTSLFDTLKTSSVTQLGLAKCRLGPGSLGKLAGYVREAEAVLTSINCLANKFGEEDLATLLTAIEGTSVRSLCGLIEGQTSAEFSGQNLGPIDCKIMAAEYRFQGFIAVVARLTLDENPLTGGDQRDVDKDITGITSLFDTLKTSSVTELGLAKCRLGPGSLGMLAKFVRDAEAALNLMTLSSTGNKYDPKTYTLTAGEQQIDLSSKSLGPADAALLAAWLHRPEVMAAVARLILDKNALTSGAPWRSTDFDTDISGITSLFDTLKTSSVTELSLAKCRLGPGSLGKLAGYVREAEAVLTSINCLANKFGEEDLATLLTAIEGTSVRSLCGLIEGQTSAEFSGQNLGPIDCKIMAAEYRFQGFIAALNSVTLDSTGNMRRQQTYTLTTGQEKIDLSEKNLGSADVALIAAWLQRPEVMVVVTAINILSNPIGDGANLLIDIFESTESIRTMLGIEDGTTALDLSGQRYGTGKLDTGCAKLLAAEFTASRCTRSVTTLILHSNSLLGDAGLTAIVDALPPGVSLQPTFRRCGLKRVTTQLLERFSSATSLDISDNDIDHLPWEFLTLKNLTRLDLKDNDRLRTVNEINEQAGVAGVHKYIRDLYRDEPTWSYCLKIVLAGPSMAGKSSLLNGLVAGEARLTTPDDRTVGLDIKMLQLDDHRRRTHNGLRLRFSCYDAGGHDEYADVHNLFFSLDALYMLLCDLSKPHFDDADKKTQIEDTVSKLVQWATSIQAYAPGSVVQMVGSHADEVVARSGFSREQTAQDTCDYYLKRVKKVLEEQREEQRRELDALQPTLPRDWERSPAVGKDSSQHTRALQLKKLIDNPLQLNQQALHVSAKTLENFDVLREALVDAAFNTRAFPEFGTLQPKSYHEIEDSIRRLGRTHHPALTWSDLRSALAQTPQPGHLDDVHSKPDQEQHVEPEPESNMEESEEPKETTVAPVSKDSRVPVDLAQSLEEDPQLLNRAMLFLRARGSVLYYDHAPTLRDRVFIRPQWLVDVIKELVRHDLREQLELLDPRFDSIETTRQLAQEFLDTGVVRTGLLPWLWRELDPPVGQDPVFITILMELLVQLGIVVSRPQRTGEVVWLLPMRLPANPPDDIPSLPGDALTRVGRRYDFRVAIPSGLVSDFLGKALDMCSTQGTTASWRSGFTSVYGDEQLTIQTHDTRSIDFRAWCVQAGKHAQVLHRLEIFETVLTTCIARMWKGTSYNVLALGSDNVVVALQDCRRAELQGEHEVMVGNCRIPLDQLILARSNFAIEADVAEQLDTLSFVSSIHDAISGKLSDLPQVQRFLSSLELTTSTELGGPYRDVDGAPEAQWSTRLATHGIGSSGIAEVDPTTIEAEYYRDGRGRALGLLHFLSRVYAAIAEILQAKVFQSHRALCDYLLRPFPWLRRVIETLAVKHGLTYIPALAELFPTASAAEPEPEILDVPSPTDFKGNYKSCLDRPYVQLELREAKSYSKPIITVFEEERRRQAFFDYSIARKTYGSGEWKWVLNIDSVTYRRDKHEAIAMLSRICEKMVGPACSPNSSPLNAPGHWDIFLSHAQAAAGDQVKTLHFLLKERGYKVWYDNDMSNRSTAAMEEGVRHSANFLLFLSGDPQMPVAASAEEGVPPHVESEPGSECASPGTASDTHIRSWLRRYKLEAYAEALENDGCDDLQHITGLDEQEIDEVLAEIEMKKVHRRTFKREWAKLRASGATASDTHIRSWLRRFKLEAYAKALEDDGYDDLQHITGLDEQEIDEVLAEIEMKKGHRKTFKREWAKLQ